MPENEHELDDEFEFEESEYPFEEWTPPKHQFTLAKVIQKVEHLNIPDSTRKKYIDDILLRLFPHHWLRRFRALLEKFFKNKTSPNPNPK